MCVLLRKWFEVRNAAWAGLHGGQIHNSVCGRSRQFLFHSGAEGLLQMQPSHVTDALPLSINFALFSSVVKYLY